MRLQEMVEDMQQEQDVLLIAASLGLPNIVDNYVPDFFATVLLRRKVLASAVAAISGSCSCSAMASTSSSVKPHRPMQSSSLIIEACSALNFRKTHRDGSNTYLDRG
jgi:hypothetical protein